MKKLVVIIPARKGSRRLKNKNIIKLGSKNLVERTIIFAKKLVKKNCIILSTDSKKIQKIGENHKIISPGLRPKYLSTNKASSEMVVMHSIRWYIKNIDKIKSILLLQPTTPFREINFFKKSIKLFFNNLKINYVSVSIIRKKIKQNSKIIFSSKRVINGVNSKNYILNGSMYLISFYEFVKKKKFITNLTKGLIISKRKYQIDIDYLKNLNQAKKYL